MAEKRIEYHLDLEDVWAPAARSRKRTRSQGALPHHGRRRRGVRFPRHRRVPGHDDAGRQADPAQRARARGDPHVEALGDGMLDAAILTRLEQTSALRAAEPEVDRPPDGQGRCGPRGDEPAASATSPGATGTATRWPTSRSAARWATSTSASRTSTGAMPTRTWPGCTRSCRRALRSPRRNRPSDRGAQRAPRKSGPIRSMRSVQNASTPQDSSSRARPAR